MPRTPSVSLPTWSVLHLEPDPMVARALKKLLECKNQDLEVRVVRSVEAARQALETSRVDVVLTADLSLPDGTADTVITECRRLGIPVVVLSGAERWYPVGVPVFIKPARTDALVATLTALRQVGPSPA